MKVCIISPIFNPLVGGPGRQALIMARHLINRGVDVIVISRRLSGLKNEVKGMEVHYVFTVMPHVHNLVGFTIKNFIISMSFALGAMIKLLKLRRRYEIVQFYSASLPLLACLPLLKILGKKIVAKTTGGRGGREAGGLDSFFLKPLLAAIFGYTDRFIAVSDEIKERLLNEGYLKKRIVKIPNGVDTKAFSPAIRLERERLRDKLGFTGKDVFLYSGRLVGGKGLDMLLEAMELILQEEKNTYLLLLGDGPLENSLKEKAGYLGISDNICFKGNVSNVHEYLNASDIFVFPSLSEGMPNSLLEAMACGLPVIASRIGGVIDIVEDGKSGILVEAGDVSELASAMVRLLENNELRQKLGAEARKRIVESFSIDRIADEYIKLYNRLIADS